MDLGPTGAEGVMKRFNVKTTTVLAMVAIGLTLAVAVTGMGFGLWIGGVNVGETVNTGQLDLAFSNAFTDDDGVVNDPLLDGSDDDGITHPQLFDAIWGPTSSADPAATSSDPKLHFDKDIGKCEAEVVPGDDSSATITKSNVYPRYHCTAWFSLVNNGSVPVKVERIVMTTASASTQVNPENGQVPADLDDADFDLNDKTGSDLKVEFANVALCEQIDPGQTETLRVSQVVDWNAPESDLLTYDVDVDVAQWNELSSIISLNNECLSLDAASLEAEVLGVIGPGGILVPLADLPAPGFDSATFSTIGAASAMFTWSGPPATFVTAPHFTGPVPIVTLSGSGEYASTPDASVWSFGADGTVGNEPTLTVGVWVKPAVDSTDMTILSKIDVATFVREWVVRLDSNRFAIEFWDESQNARISKRTPWKLLAGTWYYISATYDGSGSSSGITLYVDGAATTPVTDDAGTYIAMENTATDVMVAGRLGPGGVNQFFQGDIAGAHLGPFFTSKLLTSAELAHLFDLGSEHIGP